MKDIVIIGNGAAANSAADTIRRCSQEIPIVMVARENLPEYSACALPDYISGWVSREKLFVKKEADYIRQNISTLWGRNVQSINAQQKILTTDQEEISYDQLILATGSRPFLPPVSGCDLTGNFVVKTLDDIDAIMRHKPRQVLVVGSGNIGIEVAEALHGLGCQVTIVELLDHILPRLFDPYPASLIEKMLSDHGIQVLTGEKLLGLSGEGRVREAATDKRNIECDTVIWGVGVRQNIELAQAAGIELGGLKGIKVNDKMQTNLEGIYACGDCTESWNMLTGSQTLSLLWPNAKRQGEVAALNCLGLPARYEGAISMVVEEIMGVSIVSMGLTSNDLGNRDIELFETSEPGYYSRILLQNDCVAGMQAIGGTAGLGAIMALMKNKTPLTEVRHMLADSELRTKMNWFWPARRSLGQLLTVDRGV